MGASVSKNISNAVTKAIAKVSSNIIQNTHIGYDQSQIISIGTADGDVIIEGNRFRQRANVNMQALLNALSKEENQQKMLAELAQEAKSITSGLNLAQYSNSQDILNILVNSTSTILSTISQTCSAFASQQQAITIERVRGGVRITNNVYEQLYDILQNCAEAAVSENANLQDLSTKISQTSSAESAGISPWTIIAALLGIPVIAGLIGGIAVLKFIFPVIIIIGISLIITYYTWTKEEMKLTGFSSMISNTPICTHETMTQQQTFLDAISASNECDKTSKCKAFDWEGMKLTQTGNYTLLDPPVTRFYEDVPSKCEANVKMDNTRLLYTPNAYSGPTDPITSEPSAAVEGDIYLNTKTSQWYQRTNKWPTGWQPMGYIESKIRFNKLEWGTYNPLIVSVIKNPLKDDVYVNISNLASFEVYRFRNEDGWILEKKLKGPGLFPKIPPISNTSGFKTVIKKNWMLYTGVVCIFVGIGGTLMYKKKESFEECNDYPFFF